jgi:hypothetical protein
MGIKLELGLELGLPGSAVCLAGVCPETEIDRLCMEGLKGSSFDSAVRPGDQWEPVTGMAPVPRMGSSALNYSSVGPIADRLAVAVGTQAVVASTVVGHWGQSVRVYMAGTEAEEGN